MTPDSAPTSSPQGDEEWNKYAYYVLEELRAARARDMSIERKVDQNTLTLSALKERSGWTGFLGGMLPALGLVLWEVLKK